jgi:hypothetical protein
MKKIFINLPLFILLSVTAIGCQQKGLKNMSKDNLEVATLGGGCFCALKQSMNGLKVSRMWSPVMPADI